MSEVVADVPEGIGERIRLARENNGLTVAELARRIGVEEASLTAWEHGDRDPRANRLGVLRGVLGVSLVWLLDGRDDGSWEPTPVTAALLRQRLDRARAQLNDALSTIEEIDRTLATCDQHSELLDRSS